MESTLTYILQRDLSMESTLTYILQRDLSMESKLYIFVRAILPKGKDHRVNYTTGRNLCNGRNLVELVAVKCTTPVI